MGRLSSVENWTIKNLVDICKKRQENKWDCVIFWSGIRGSGKSTGNWRMCNRFKCFKPQRDMVYSRNDVMELMKTNQYHVIMDDEAVRTGYKRNFFEQDQKKLIQMINMNRDNFNIYSGCIPNFYDLDKDLRNLCTMHIHVVSRGRAIVMLPKTEKIHSGDIWDTKINQKIEQAFMVKKKIRPNAKVRYHKFTTFVAYLYYEKLLPSQEELYTKLKKEKKQAVYECDMSKEDKTQFDMYTQVLEQVKMGVMTENALRITAKIMNINTHSLRRRINLSLNEEGNGMTLSDYMKIEKKVSPKNEIIKLRRDKVQSPITI